MTKTFFRTLWTMTVLLSLLLLLLTPPALADGVDAGTDAVEISPDGTVTLISGHIAGEGVSSVQFRLRTEGEAQFSFAGDIAGGYVTNCVAGDGTLDVYIAGTVPLMQPGYTSRVLGTVSPADKVQPVQSSLQYVYGVSVVSQNAGLDEVSGDSGEPMAQLQNVLDEANTLFSGAHKYTEESWARLNAAIAAIELLLQNESVTAQEADEAIAAYRQACHELVVAGTADLSGAVDAARAVDESQYTQDSYQALLDAIAAAEAVLAKGEDASSEDVANAIQALRAAMLGLVPQQSADNSGGVIGDGPDNGSDQRSAAPDGQSDPTATDGSGNDAQPTATPAATPRSAIPATGDETPVLLWMVVLCLCGGLLAVLLRRVRTRG